jgi:hypothetical protein
MKIPEAETESAVMDVQDLELIDLGGNAPHGFDDVSFRGETLSGCYITLTMQARPTGSGDQVILATGKDDAPVEVVFSGGRAQDFSSGLRAWMLQEQYAHSMLRDDGSPVFLLKTAHFTGFWQTRVWEDSCGRRHATPQFFAAEWTYQSRKAGVARTVTEGWLPT